MPAEVPTAEELTRVERNLADSITRTDERVTDLQRSAVWQVWDVVGLRRAIDSGRPGTVLLSPGVYELGAPLVLPSYVRLVGAGTGATSIRAGDDLEYLVGVEDHASSVSIEKLRLDCDRKARTGVRIVPAPRDPDNHLDYGITAPDPRHRMFDVEVYDAGHSGVVLGEHARGTRLDHVLVRRAGTVGFHCGMADSFVTNCEATVVAGAPYSGAAAFWVGSVNSVYANCKGWWGRGAGWRVRGSRNRFIACEAQDTAWHGWYVEYDLNTFNACVADNSGFKDSGGIGGVDGFYFVGAGATSVTGCLAFNRSPTAKYQRHGFNVPAAMLAPVDYGQAGSFGPQVRFIANVGRDNAGKLVNVRG